MKTSAITQLARVLLVAALLAGAAAPALASASAEVAIDRLTYTDGTHRNGPDPRFVKLGFDVKRSAGVIGAATPDLHLPYLIASSEGPDQVQVVTVDLKRRGDLEVLMFGGSGPAYPWPVKGTTSPDGKVRGGTASWLLRRAKPGTYTFSVHFRARAVDPNIRSFLPETRVTLRGGGGRRTLLLERHIAPLYGSPEITPGRIYGPIEPVARRDEWVAHPSFSAMGAHHWSTGPVMSTRRVGLEALIPRAGAHEAINTGSMGTAFSGDAKVTAVTGFLIEDRKLAGFEIGAQTSDLFGPFFPFTANPLNGRIYDGDGGTVNVSLSVGSAHWDKRSPRNDAGRLRWDWDGAWARGWSNVDTFRAPGIRGAGDPIYTTETALYPGAYGGDVDNRSGRKTIRGPKWFMDLPPTRGFMFIAWGGAAPPKSEFHAEGGFSRDGRRFFLRPTIGPGGYLLEAETDGYYRKWQPALSVGLHAFGVRPEDVDDRQPTTRRVFTMPRGSNGQIGVAVTTGLIKHFEVPPGIWEITASTNDVDLRLLRSF